MDAYIPVFRLSKELQVQHCRVYVTPATGYLLGLSTPDGRPHISKYDVYFGSKLKSHRSNEFTSLWSNLYFGRAPTSIIPAHSMNGGENKVLEIGVGTRNVLFKKRLGLSLQRSNAATAENGASQSEEYIVQRPHRVLRTTRPA